MAQSACPANVEAMIMDSLTGEALPPGEIGEIMVRGPNVMAGYWQTAGRDRGRLPTMAGCTRATWARWISGLLHHRRPQQGSDRRQRFNVYPREVEEVLYRHPAVQEACAVGLPDEYRGETVAAVIVLKPGFRAPSRRAPASSPTAKPT